MSWPSLEAVFKSKHLWRSPSQFAVVAVLAWRDWEKRGYASPSKQEIADLIGCSKRRVHQLIEELEAMEAIQRLGVDRELGGRNRYVLTLDRAVNKARQRGMKQAAPPQGGDKAEGMQPAASPDGAGISGGEATDGVRGCNPFHPIEEKKMSTEERIAHGADAPRLPALLIGMPLRQSHASSVEAARKERRSRLYRRVCQLARSLLHDQAVGTAFNGDSPITTEGDLVEATKALCGQKRISGYAEVVYGACASEWLKFTHPDIVCGIAPRPRDLRRRS